MEQAILAWNLEQKSSAEPEKKDLGAAQDEPVASSNASLDSLEKAVGALSSDELPRGFGEALEERIELDTQRQAEAAEGSRHGPETACGASSRTSQPD